MTRRNPYRRKCRTCKGKLKRHEVLYNQGECDNCIEERIEEAHAREKREIEEKALPHHERPSHDFEEEDEFYVIGD